MAEPYVVVIKTSYRLMKNYNYLVVDPISRKAVVVDPAWEMEKIDSAIHDLRADLCGVLITHSHPDHIDLAESISLKYECHIWMSKAEIMASGFKVKRLIAIEEEPWWISGLLVQPILTPGHTPGCVCYMIGNSLFTGDVLFAEGCGICPDMTSARMMYDSLEKLKKILSDRTRIFPGHSYGKRPGQLFSNLLKDNLYLQFDNREIFAKFRLQFQRNSQKKFNFS